MPTTAQRERTAERMRQLCQSRAEPEPFRLELLHLLRGAVPFDSCALVTCDPATGTAVSFHVEGSDRSFVPAVIRNEYLDADFNKFDDLGRSLWPVGILSEATNGKLERSARFRRASGTFTGHRAIATSCAPRASSARPGGAR